MFHLIWYALLGFIAGLIAKIGGTEIMHFQTWQDKAGNAHPLTDPTNGLVFPDLNADGEILQTNLIMPEPTIFLNRKFPKCSIIRPTETDGAATSALNALTADGLFIGQTPKFFAFLSELAQAADVARPGGPDENDENDRMEADAPGTHILTVNRGSGSGRHVAGASVTVTADAPPAGQKFARWTGDIQILANPFIRTTTATVPSIDVTITATYADKK